MKLFRRIWNTQGLARWIFLIGLAITVLFLVLAVLAPVIAPYGFAESKVEGVKLPKLASPDGTFVFGTNDMFFDVFSRVVWGARTAVIVILLSVAISVLVGVPLGLLSGYAGRATDRVLVFVMDALYAFPALLLAIVMAFLLNQKLGNGIVAAALSLTVVYIPQYFRVVRNTTVSMREATFVEAAKALGAGPVTIMRKYLFGNVVQSVPVIATLNAADALGTLAGLGFLGLGIQPNEAAEWGYDLNRALDDAQSGIWWTGVFPGLAIVLLIAALTLVGEGLNETLNPSLVRRRVRTVRFTRPVEGTADLALVAPEREHRASGAGRTEEEERP